MGMGPRVLASGSNQVPASISVIKKGTALHPSHEPVLTSTKAPSSPLFPQKVGRALFSFSTCFVILCLRVLAELHLNPNAHQS